MSARTCKTCRFGALEKTSHNGSPPAFRQACDLTEYRRYPVEPCAHWDKAPDLIDQPGRGDSGNH